MDRISGEDFNITHLRQHPVWTWSSDLYSSEGDLVPVPMTREGLAEADTLLIHAMLRTVAGKLLEGVVVYDPDFDDVFAIEFFIGDTAITLNKNLPDLARKELTRFAKISGEDASCVLPIRFDIVPKSLRIPPGEFSVGL